MTTINLYQNKEEAKGASFQGANMGLVLSIILLLAVGLTFFGFKFYISKLQAGNLTLGTEIQDANKRLVGLTKLEQVVDVQSRLVAITSNLQIQGETVKRVEMTSILDKLGVDLNKGSVLESYSFSGDKLTIKFNSSSFTAASQQILNFKKSTYFSEINLGGISRKDNIVTCDLGMKIPKTVSVAAVAK